MAPSATTGRSRSSTTSSFRSDSSRAPVASNETPLGGVSSQPIAVKDFSGWTAAAGDSTLASSYASQHTLKTLKGRGGGDEGDSPTSSRSNSPARGSNKLQDARRGPQFIIDLAPSSSSAEDRNDSTTPHGRNRSATFGGVELPPAPAAPTSFHPSASSSTPAASSRRPPLSRADTDEDGSFRSIPSSLHLGGGTTFAERRPMLHAGLKAGGLFLTSLLLLYVLLKTLLPPIDEEHRGMIKLPKSFDELKGLNEVLQVRPFRVVLARSNLRRDES